jgi:hypothetical protein
MRAGEDADAPIDERLDQKEEALEEAGADVPKPRQVASATSKLRFRARN